MVNLNVEKVFLSVIGTKEDFEWFIYYDTNLISHLSKFCPELKQFIDKALLFIPDDEKRAIFGDLTYERVVNMFEKERPDLYKIAISEKGKIWLKREVDDFRKYFLG